jgi:hypothetical protein
MEIVREIEGEYEGYRKEISGADIKNKISHFLYSSSELL